MTGKGIALVIVIVVLAIAFLGWKTTARAAYEAAEYKVLQKDGVFEIREYPDLKMATTGMEFAAQGRDGSFMRLFRYISGANDDEQKIAMTVPVFMDTASEDKAGKMGFVLPRNVAQQGVPNPSNDEVKIKTRAGGRFAVIRFSGRMNRELSAEAEEKLRGWMQEKGLIGDGDAEAAGYDPPWTPGPMRRNEILIRLKVPAE